MKYYFPIHLDGGNRGCEAIAEGTAILLNEPKENLIGLCRNVELDKRLGIDDYITLKPFPKDTISYRVYRKLIYFFTRNVNRHRNITYKHDYSSFLKSMSDKDIMVSTGGDMMCYGNNQVIATNKMAIAKGCKTVLWGCSMGAINLTPEKEDALRKFTLIYARESLSYDFLKSLGLKNVVCLPDPAFVLEPEIIPLPSCFNDKKVIGLNLSNFTVGADHLDTPFGKEIMKLLDYIIHKTDFHILMVPHVMWNFQDDRLLSFQIKEKYSNLGERISVLDSATMSYLQIRHVISHCHVFIGGRTHAVISAYSTCVPSIALGYSIKSQGIAKDIGLSEELVVDTKNITEDGLLLSFKYLMENYESVSNHLNRVIPEYRKRPFEIREIIGKMSF